MQSTDSKSTQDARYDFSFAWESPYGHVVQLLERLGLRRGAVIDLGCGVGSISDPLRDLGYEYIGVDIDTEALDRVSRRGFETHEVDLSRTNDLAAQMREWANGRKIAAVFLLDVIEHIRETRPLLKAVREGLDLLGRPPLLVSVPNVAHTDLGAKLVFGRWDYTGTGLLDSTHVQFFTAARLREQTQASGLLEIDAHDFKLRDSDQHFPSDHPALSRDSPVAQAISMWREMADSDGDTIQFIRAFVAGDTAPGPSSVNQMPSDQPSSTSPLAIVVRTQGKRSAHLREALTCLAAQTYENFRVLLMVHSDTPEAMSSVTALVEEFGLAFSSRVSIVHVTGGRRAKPLNVALSKLQSDYVAFLDDDDLVMANWVESFVQASGEGAIVRSAAAVRHVSPPSEGEQAPYLIHSALEFRYSLDFDLIHHFWGNETPICTFAVPRSLIETFTLRFDEQLPVLEDWAFLMQCVALAPVRDTRQVTSIYQMWRSGESSSSLHEVELWQATHRVLQDRSNLRPLVLPVGSVDHLRDMCERLAGSDDALRELSAQMGCQQERADRMADEVDAALKELERMRERYLTTINSRRWQILDRPARLIAGARVLRRHPLLALRMMLGSRDVEDKTSQNDDTLER